VLSGNQKFCDFVVTTKCAIISPLHLTSWGFSNLND